MARVRARSYCSCLIHYVCVCIMRLWLHLFSSAMTMTMRGGTAKHNSDVHRVLKCSYDISSGAVHRHSAIFALPFRPAIELVSTTHTQTHVRCMHCKCIHECERVPSERIQNHHHRRATWNSNFIDGENNLHTIKFKCFGISFAGMKRHFWPCVVYSLTLTCLYVCLCAAVWVGRAMGQCEAMCVPGRNS